jgi:alpha-galactosidase
MFAVVGDLTGRSGILAGFLSQRQAFGSLEAYLDPAAPHLRRWANGDGVQLGPEASFSTDWACIQFVDLDAQSPLGPYLDAVARQSKARQGAPTPVGWCSWYQYSESVTQEDVLSNASWADEHRQEIPLHVIQIDDGFEAEVGDWYETSAGFPQGMAVVSRRLREKGFQPGLWAAPFVAKRRSRLVKEHPDWVLRNRWNLPVNAGCVWDTFTQALDVTHPEFLEHLHRLVGTFTGAWGYEYLKLDFLYAGALPGVRQDRRVTRAQGLYRALCVIREAAGDRVTLVGCGCPIGSGIGVFDCMRIGPDVAARWRPAYRGIEPFFRSEPDLPSARNAMRNAITRAAFHRRWWVNDPDCLILREEDSHLTSAEVQALATVVALSSGSIIVSDDLPSLSRTRREWLARLLPPLPDAARAVDWLDSSYPARLVLSLEGPIGRWHLVAVLNWRDGPQDVEVDLAQLGLPRASSYHVVDFWGVRYQRLDGPRLPLPAVPGHGVRLVAVRTVRAGPQWVGDNLHVSQGLQVRRWATTDSRLTAIIDLARRGHGVVWLALPEAPREARFNDDSLPWREELHGVYRFDVRVAGRGRLEIVWG